MYRYTKGKHALFPGKWKAKVWQSDVGCVAVVAALAAWAVSAGSLWPIVALYVGPYLVGGLYKLNPVDPYSLKAPGVNP